MNYQKHTRPNSNLHHRASYGDQKAETPDMCIYCNSKIIKLIKKLPRTFTCSNSHRFTIGEYRKNEINKKTYRGKL